MPVQGRHIEVQGVVQGVGFRPFVFQLAQREGVTGRVRNDTAGVIIDAFGSDEVLDRFVQRLAAQAPPAARVRSVDWSEIPAEALDAFVITSSASSAERNVSIPPDLATCDDCLEELFDPSNRRYRYPFTNCTNCGPRYSIVRDVPYDRPKTTMASFEMCDDCRREYEDPADRRFHAQPNACPACGPKLTAVTPTRQEIATNDVIRFAARAIRAQMIVAVKGIGGFHLACDATSPAAVQRLRERKHRDSKPLAVMVATVDDAEKLAEVSEGERALLTSVERPIVLLRRRADAPVARGVAGENPLIGIFLPYTPLHHILLRQVGLPLVMTSGNLAEEPMVSDNREALEQLKDVADIFVVHDRGIETRVDDSVARVLAGRPTLFRRARGYVPRAVDVRTPFAEPLLACGAHLKNAICIGAGRQAFLGPHIGDLENVATLGAFEAAVEQMKRFVGVEPAVVAHDLHPDYLSTRYAEALAGVRRVAVQHHHAHIMSAAAENHLDGPVLGFAWDGTGYGTDGTSWGGEAMIADAGGYERIATFRPIALAGGDQAIRQVWRIALAVLDDAFGGEPPLQALPLFASVPKRGVETVRRMIASQLNAPRARGVGRYFDALGAIALGMAHARYEGEVAFLWNMAADLSEHGRYPLVIRDGMDPWEIDLRPLVRAAVADLLAGRGAGTVSARFHNTLAHVSVAVAQAVIATRGKLPVVLSGGCFQNAELTHAIVRGVQPFACTYLHHDIPPGDGGVALGQAVIADAAVRSGSKPAVFPSEVPACV